MKRTIIKIDEALCNGCGACVSGCHEGALRMIDGKAVMVSELYCDGLGACIGECPVGAISLEEREAEPYCENSVMERLVPKGEAVVKAHLKHLKDHGQQDFYEEGIDYLNRHRIAIDLETPNDLSTENLGCGCPGSMARSFAPASDVRPQVGSLVVAKQSSELRQFPVQLHLINPQAPFFKGSSLLLAADCAAFASGEFHSRFLKGRMLAIACPKLDNNQPQYIEKLVTMIDVAEIDHLTVLVMEVPCCGGLVKIAELARERASRNIPLKVVTLTVQGAVKSEQWMR